MGDSVNQTGLHKDCTTGCVNVRCTAFPEVSTDGAYVLLIYCIFINILHILVERLYFPTDIRAWSTYSVVHGKLVVLNYQHWLATAVGETSGGFSGCVCMTALNVVQDVQFGNVCLLSSTSYAATWSWMYTKHFGRNFMTTVGTLARWISLVRWNRVIWNCFQEKEKPGLWRTANWRTWSMWELCLSEFQIVLFKVQWPNAAHFMRNLTRVVYTNLTFSFPERADRASAKFAWEAILIMVLLGFREHAAAKSSITTNTHACTHLMLEKTNRILGTGPEQFQQTPFHNSNQRILDGNNDIRWSCAASTTPGSRHVSARWCNCPHLLT